jgi:putative cell wall-binding protein
MTGRRFITGALALLLLLALAGPASGHAERAGYWPLGEGSIPEVRTDGPALVVCKADTASRLVAFPREVRERNEALLERCEFEHIQEAVDAVAQRGTRILVLPGVYREEPNRVLAGECAEEKAGGHGHGGGGQFTYEDHLRCPHVVTLIHILGQDADQQGSPEPTDDDAERYSGEVACRNQLCDLQIEGTGASPLDVVIDGGFDEEGGWLKENGIRGDRVDGLVITNLTVQRFGFNGIYVLETDGYRFDRTVARWNEGYAYLNFMTDNGLYVDCEGYGSGDGAVYPGSQPQHEREGWAAEVRGCSAHRNMVGLSGTAGNSLLVEDNEFFDNVAGWQTDSLVPNHPGLPTGYSTFRNNRIFRNNMDYYGRFVQDGTCQQQPEAWQVHNGTVCPLWPIPVGTGVLLAAGNHMHYTDNDVFDNWRQGFMQFWVPGTIRGDDGPEHQFDTAHHNRYEGNLLGYGPGDDVRPNGIDFWWDDQGEGNCWQGNDPATGEVTSNARDPRGLPDCDSGGSPGLPANPEKSGSITPCITYDRESNNDPTGCDWLAVPSMPAGRTVTVTASRLAGTERVATALEVSRQTFTRSDAVVLARSDAYPDALAGAPLAAAMDAPILLTPSDRLPREVAEEIRRLGARRVYLLGGTAALASPLERAVRTGRVEEVRRIGGATRFHTAANIADIIGGPLAYVVKGADPIEHRAWPDAVSASASAALQRRPLLLAAPDHLPGPSAEALRRLGITDATVVGGEAALSAAVSDAVAARVERVDRLGGANRYETSRLLAERSRLIYANDTDLWVATGGNWPDALVAGPAVAATRGVLLLVPGRDAAALDSADTWFDARPGATERVRVLGGRAAVTSAVGEALVDRARGD